MAKFSLPSVALVTRVAILAFGLALFFEQAGARQLLHLDEAAGPVMMTPVYWTSLLAPAFFLWGLWAATNVLVRMDRGDAFGPSMVKGLRELGGALMLGAFCAVVVRPSFAYLAANGYRYLRGVKYDYTVENLTLAFVGLMLMLLARHGQKLRSDLEQFV